jgi:hypothetical protein
MAAGRKVLTVQTFCSDNYVSNTDINEHSVVKSYLIQALQVYFGSQA